LIASLATPLLLWWLGHPQLALLFTVLTLLLWFTHRENIRRLVAGNEGRIGAKA
jgi:glycerol-3-phosphate acyltransferase PlsY